MADFLLSVGVDVGLSYEQMQTDIATLVSRLNSNPPKIKVAFDIDNAAIQQLQTQISDISNSLRGTGVVNVGTAGAGTIAADMSSVAANAGRAAKETRAANAAFGQTQTAVKTLSKDSKEYYDALKRVRTLLSQVTSNQEKWTAAKNGKSSSAYNDLSMYAGELEDLISKLRTGKMSVDDFKKEMSRLSSGVATASSEIKAAGENTQTFGQRIGGLAAKFGTWFSITRVIMAAVRAVREMVSEVIELDTAMTELKKVTDASDATYDKFLDNAAKRAKNIGASMTDVVKVSSDFARLGFSLEDSETVADAALIYKNIGDGIQDIDQASASLISTMQAFGIKADDIMSIVDKFNVTGNKFAISSGGIGDALLNSAAALSAAGNSLDESIALITAANTTIQNPEVVGTAMKTVSMYLRAAKTEAEEAGESTEGMADSVSELRDELLSLTGNKVDIQIDDDTFKSTYQILQELSEVWDDLSDVSRANITELIGGKRNANVISALLNDFTIAEEAMTQMQGAAGSALAENEKWKESIQGHITDMKNAFSDFARNLVSTDLVKNFVDLATWILNVLNGLVKLIDKIGGLKTVLLAVASVLLLVKGYAIVASITKFCSAVKTGIINITQIIPSAVAAWQAYAAGTVTASAAMQASIPVIGWVLSLLTLLGAGIALATDRSDEFTDEVEESAQEVEHFSTTAKDTSDTISGLVFSFISANNALQTLTGSVEMYNDARDALISGLKIERTELQRLIDAYGDYDTALLHASLNKLNSEETDLRIAFDEASSVGYSQDYIDLPYIDVYDTDGLESWEKAFDAISGIQGVKTYMLNLKNAYDQIYEYVPHFELDTDDALVEQIGAGAAQYITNYNAFKEILEALRDSVGEEHPLYKEIADAYKSIKPTAEKIINAQNELNESLATQEILAGVLESGVPRTQEEFSVWRQGLIDSASASGDFAGTLDDVTNAIDTILMQEPTFRKFFSNISNESTNTTKSFGDILSSVQALSPAFDKLDKIYADIYNKEGFDWGSVINNEDFANTFGHLGSSYEDFIKTIISHPNDIASCQQAFDNLVAAYLTGSGVLSGLTEETRNIAVAMLEQMGVANAAAMVDYNLTYEKERLKYTTGEYADMSYDTVLALYGECEAGSVAQQVLAQLALAKMQANETGISTDSDIDQMIALANAANATTESIANMTAAKKLLAQADEAQQEYEYNKMRADMEWDIVSTFDPDTTDPNELSWIDEYEYYQRNADEFAAQYESLRKQAEELLNKPIEYNKFNAEDFKFGGGVDTQKAITDAEKPAKSETWFEKQLAEHQHLVKMEQETEADYLAWLSDAYPQAYEEGIIELKDFYKYQEEVFKGLRDVFKDYLGDVEHEISMREQYEGESDKIIELYESLMEEVEDEIADAREQGLDDTDDYIQELQKKWQGYYDSVKDMRDEAEENAKDAVDELVDYRLDMIKQEIKDEKDALDKKLDNLKEFYDKQKEMLQDQHDEEEYLDEQAEKRKSVSDLKAEIAMLENDDSAWAQKRKIELQEELSNAEDELNEFEDDHALDLALDALDDAYNAQEEQIRAEMEALEEKLNDPEALFNQALQDIKTNTGNLYNEMLEYNRKHGSGNDEDINQKYEDAYKALLEYEDVYGEAYKGIVLPNSTNYTPETGKWDDSEISGSGSDNQSSGGSTVGSSTGSSSTKPKSPPSNGATVKVKKSATHFGSKSKGAHMASFVPGSSYTVYQTKDNQVLVGKNGVYIGWVNLSDIEGYASGTGHATPGLHRIDELGSEYLFTSNDGNRYRVLNDGDKVLNAKASDFLYEFANGGGDVLEKIIKSAFGTSLFDHIQPVIHNNEVRMGDIVIQGSATQQTVSEIRRAQRESLTDMLKSLNKLNR